MIQISIHAPHAGSDWGIVHVRANSRYFNPRSPCGERHLVLMGTPRFFDFNPRSPCGERPSLAIPAAYLSAVFQPTLPMRGATRHRSGSLPSSRFQPTLPMRGATARCQHPSSPTDISTHAPHAGSDASHGRGHRDEPISTHAPHAGSDLSKPVKRIG